MSETEIRDIDKMDKRSKEYKEAIQKQNDNKIEEMEKRMKEMEELLQSVGQVAANTAKTIKSGNAGVTSGLTAEQLKIILGKKVAPPTRKVITPRFKEYQVMVKFLEEQAPNIALNRKLCINLGVCKMYKDVANALEYMKRDNYLRNKALEEGVVSPDFKKFIVKKEKPALKS